MRSAPIGGRTAHFGPRRLGWGLGPVTRERWIVIAALAGLSTWLQRRYLDTGA